MIKPLGFSAKKLWPHYNSLIKSLKFQLITEATIN